MGSEQRDLYLCPGLVIRTFDPHIHVYPHQPSRLVGTRGDFQRKGSACSNLGSIARKQPSAANSSRVRAALRKAVNFKTWRTASSRWRITSEASPTLITMRRTVPRRPGPAARPLLPKKSTFCGVLGRRLSCNGTAYRRRCNGRSSIPPGPWARLETASLRGQIARFLHKHKDEAGRGKQPVTEETPSDTRSGVAVGQ